LTWKIITVKETKCFQDSKEEIKIFLLFLQSADYAGPICRDCFNVKISVKTRRYSAKKTPAFGNKEKRQ